MTGRRRRGGRATPAAAHSGTALHRASPPTPGIETATGYYMTTSTGRVQEGVEPKRAASPPPLASPHPTRRRWCAALTRNSVQRRALWTSRRAVLDFACAPPRRADPQNALSGPRRVTCDPDFRKQVCQKAASTNSQQERAEPERSAVVPLQNTVFVDRLDGKDNFRAHWKTTLTPNQRDLMLGSENIF